MSRIKFSKVVNSLPSELEPDAIYFVKNGSSVLAYITNGVGQVVPYDVTASLESLGLENVDNTSDMDKPISTAVQSELGERYTKTESDQTFTKSNDIRNIVTVTESQMPAEPDSDTLYIIIDG